MQTFRTVACLLAAALAFAVYPLLALASALPTTRPSAGDKVWHERADGTRQEFGPADGRYTPTNRDVVALKLVRPDGSVGDWLPVATQPSNAPLAAEPPPTDGPLVEPGQSWAAAFRSAKPGTAVYLRAGQTYAGPGLVDAGVRLADVRLAVWPVGGPRAVIRVPEGTALALWGARNVTLRGITFAADKPTAQGVRFFAGSKNVLLDGCEVTNFTLGVTSEGSAGKRNAGVELLNCRIHRNWHPANDDSSGLFASATDGLVLRGNVFEANGWRDGDKVARGTLRNHDAYVAGDCGPIVAAGNVFARAASHGLQARSGGTIENNLFLDNPIHLSVGLVNGGGPIVEGGVTAVVRGNAFVGTRPLGGTSPRGWGVEISNAADVVVRNNAFARDGDYDPKLGNFPAAIKLDLCSLETSNPQYGRAIAAKRVVIEGNLVRWPFAPLWRHPSFPAAAVTVQQTWGTVDVTAQATAAAATVAAMAK